MPYVQETSRQGRKLTTLQATHSLSNKYKSEQCDENRPVCNRCQKANLVCHGVAEDRNFIFLDENEYAVGQKKRPRGPNLKTTIVTQNGTQRTGSKEISRTSGRPSDTLPADLSGGGPQEAVLLPPLTISLDDQALAYYSRRYVDQPHGLPGIVECHLKLTDPQRCFSEPECVLSLAIRAVSLATFGRAQKSPAALSNGYQKYSTALAKTHLVVRNGHASRRDEVLLAVMLLSFYENAVTDGALQIPSQVVQDLASKSFAHHDGAIAMLNLRRQTDRWDSKTVEVEKLVRRQLIRSLLLRSIDIPAWLRDGTIYGEYGTALELDLCMVKVAELRHRAISLAIDTTTLKRSDPSCKYARLRDLLDDAQSVDNELASWADNLSPEYHYSKHRVQRGDTSDFDRMGFDAHIYMTVGHAGIWGRYRALRLIVNDIRLKTLSILLAFPDSSMEAHVKTAKSNVARLADDLCASLPYILGFVETREVSGNGVIVVAKSTATLAGSVTPATASLLCWSLAMVTMVSNMPEQHRRYLRDRLLDVSEVVGDGVLERIAESLGVSSEVTT
ncbi:MAG: hypothetical protein M1820_002016 [Bogoriella megaspora]|nr:MAG: hypothetical protein M1820_002016 [Bogoriella megaspora]